MPENGLVAFFLSFFNECYEQILGCNLANVSGNAEMVPTILKGTLKHVITLLHTLIKKAWHNRYCEERPLIGGRPY